MMQSMTKFPALVHFLYDYCAFLGSSCPLVLVFLLSRLDSDVAQGIVHSARHKIKLLLQRIDMAGKKSLLYHFPSFTSVCDGSDTASKSYLLSAMQKKYSSQCFMRKPGVNSSFVPFSESKIWEIQQQYYEESLLEAWNIVPFQISSNPLVAQQYMADVEKMLNDLDKSSQRGNDTGKVIMVEIGAGHGILSYLLAKELQLRNIDGMVICTDFHDRLFVKLLELPWIKNVCAMGYLDFAVCGAAVTVTTANGLQLLHSGELAELLTLLSFTYFL